MNKENLMNNEPTESGRASTRLGRSMAMILAPLLIAACGGDANSAAGGAGNIEDSEITVVRIAQSDPPDITQMEISSIACSVKEDSPKTRVEFKDGGFVVVENQQLGSKKAWRVIVALPDLEFTQRDSILQAEAGDKFTFDSSGNIRGVHEFGVYGSDPVKYGILFNIIC